jgi:hypothetical protein
MIRVVTQYNYLGYDGKPINMGYDSGKRTDMFALIGGDRALSRRLLDKNNRVSICPIRQSWAAKGAPYLNSLRLELIYE